MLLQGQRFQHRDGFPMQPVSRPVRRNQRAVTPDRAQLLTADALPDLTTQLHVRPGIQHFTLSADHLLGQRWRLSMHFATHPQQHREGGYQQHRQSNPKPLGRVHRCTPHLSNSHGRCCGLNAMTPMIQIRKTRFFGVDYRCQRRFTGRVPGARTTGLGIAITPSFSTKGRGCDAFFQSRLIRIKAGICTS